MPSCKCFLPVWYTNKNLLQFLHIFLAFLSSLAILAVTSLSLLLWCSLYIPSNSCRKFLSSLKLKSGLWFILRCSVSHIIWRRTAGWLMKEIGSCRDLVEVWSGICLDGPEKTMHTLERESQCPDRDSNRSPPEYATPAGSVGAGSMSPAVLGENFCPSLVLQWDSKVEFVKLSLYLTN
jgi:hypothetical protein